MGFNSFEVRWNKKETRKRTNLFNACSLCCINSITNRFNKKLYTGVHQQIKHTKGAPFNYRSTQQRQVCGDTIFMSCQRIHFIVKKGIKELTTILTCRVAVHTCMVHSYIQWMYDTMQMHGLCYTVIVAVKVEYRVGLFAFSSTLSIKKSWKNYRSG